MAKPDLDDGFVQIAYELWAAVSAAGFNRGAWIVLSDVFMQIYGYAKLPTATLSPTEIGHRVSMHKQHVSRAIQDLVRAGLIVKVSHNEYRFNKDHESWNLPGESLEEKQARISYALSAPSLARSYINHIDKDSVTKSGYTETTDKQKAVTKSGYDPDCVTRFGYESNQIWLRDTNKERAPEELRELREIQQQQPPTPLLPSEPSRQTTISAPPPGEKSSPSEAAPLRSSRVPSHSPEQLAQLIAWVRETLGERAELECFTGKLAAFARSYPIDWIEQAVLKAAVGAKPGKLASYVNTILIEWFPDGPPPRADPRPAAPVRREPPTPDYVPSQRRKKSLPLAPDRNGTHNPGDPS